MLVVAVQAVQEEVVVAQVLVVVAQVVAVRALLLAVAVQVPEGKVALEAQERVGPQVVRRVVPGNLQPL